MAHQNSTAGFRSVLLVFVSSTFGDLKPERNVLQAKVSPRLEQLCAPNNFKFEAKRGHIGIVTAINFRNGKVNWPNQNQPDAGITDYPLFQAGHDFGFRFTFMSMPAIGKSVVRQIRFFIRSTFRAMKAERDYLGKFTLPQLRRLRALRGVTLGEVDSRRFVTVVEAVEGSALPICLEEIRRCRTNFIGTVGEHHDSVLQYIPDNLIAKQRLIQQHHQHFITELEIIHGVLLNVDLQQHPGFYFYNPSVLARVPNKNKSDLTSESPELELSVQRRKYVIRRVRDEHIFGAQIATWRFLSVSSVLPRKWCSVNLVRTSWPQNRVKNAKMKKSSWKVDPANTNSL